jgi:hypothetical protein
MKFVALLLAIVATPALAQTAAPAPAAVAPTPAPAAAATRLSLQTPIETIAADPAGKAVLAADIPGLLTHPMYDSFKSMNLADLQGMSEGKLTDAMLAKTNVDFAAIK